MKHIDYKIGDDVVCIDVKINHATKSAYGLGGLQLHKVYKVLDITKRKCCGIHLIDIGKKTDVNLVRCRCGNISDMNIDYYSADRFRKLDNLVNISELTEILDQENFVSITNNVQP
jgi:hypothetical protein